MPVILDPDTFDLWLDPDLPLETAKAVLRPYGGEMEVRPVGRRVNDVRNDDPGCMETAGLL
jgi:putative SOS response-associated peptidase YedK